MVDQLSNDLASLRIDRTPGAPPRSSGGFVAVVLLAALGAAGYFGYQRLAAMQVREGDHVLAGAVLFRVEDAAQRAALSAARSRSFAARARIQTAIATLAEVKQQFVRETRLADAHAMAAATAEDRREQV